jgi:M6 family metalloprotease-like protein
MKKELFIIIAFLMPLFCFAQNDDVVSWQRKGCMLFPKNAGNSKGLQSRSVFSPIRSWDASREYRQLVVLFEYSDSSFYCDNPHDRYNNMFNTTGYNEGVGPGCVADYFREQSGGLCNLVFDVFGPYKVEAKATDLTTKTNYGNKAMWQALKLFMSDNPQLDFTPYDWDGNGDIEQVIFVCASYGGNTGHKGFVWPNAGWLKKDTVTHDGLNIGQRSITPELLVNRRSAGIGTICHEFSHNLGLPDIYPTDQNATMDATCDEWDLMDGGNYTNWGWCPPNLSAQEKMHLGWLTPTELSEPTTITDMKPISEGGPSYIIHHTDNEYLILENRKQSGWDAGVPGEGLLITHIDYYPAIWSANNVNNDATHLHYDIVHADNINYTEWYDRYRGYKYKDRANMLYSQVLSTSPYPWQTDSTLFVNNGLTDETVPATIMYNKKEGSNLLGKAITDIQLDANGNISFKFMNGSTGINIPTLNTADDKWYTLEGLLIKGKPKEPGVYINQHRKILIKK